MACYRVISYKVLQRQVFGDAVVRLVQDRLQLVDKRSDLLAAAAGKRSGVQRCGDLFLGEGEGRVRRQAGDEVTVLPLPFIRVVAAMEC